MIQSKFAEEEEKYPKDNRPRKAIQALKNWIETGVFKMAVIRRASLDAHTAARACGQAVATAHVPTHSYGAAIYAQQAVFRATAFDTDVAVAIEWDWQYQHLLEHCK